MKVLKSGVQAFVEDWPGRLKYQNKGVAVSGATDSYALRMGNLLVGNKTGEAGIEIIAGFFSVEFLKDHAISLTGADMRPMINGEPVPMWEAIAVKKGDILTTQTPRGRGFVMYLNVAGGVDVPLVWGSKSTCTTGGYGGFEGRALKAGDVLKFGASAFAQSDIVGRKLKKEYIPEYSDAVRVRATVGYFASPNYFTEQGMEVFFNHPYQVDNNANRGALRLRIPKEKFYDNMFARTTGGVAGDHPSMCAMTPYRVPGGLNIGGDSAALFHVEGVSAGGFICPLAVISADIWKIGQAVPLQSTIEFIPCDHKEAAALLKEQEKLFSESSVERQNFSVT